MKQWHDVLNIWHNRQCAIMQPILTEFSIMLKVTKLMTLVKLSGKTYNIIANVFAWQFYKKCEQLIQLIKLSNLENQLINKWP